MTLLETGTVSFFIRTNKNKNSDFLARTHSTIVLALTSFIPASFRTLTPINLRSNLTAPAIYPLANPIPNQPEQNMSAVVPTAPEVV